MTFWQVYLYCLCRWKMWTHWFFLFLISLHLYGAMTAPDYQLLRLFGGFVVIFLVAALAVFVGCLEGYQDYKDYMAHQQSERSNHAEGPRD